MPAAKPAAKKKSGKPPRAKRTGDDGTYKERALKRTRELAAPTDAATVPRRSAGSREVRPGARGDGGSPRRKRAASAAKTKSLSKPAARAARKVSARTAASSKRAVECANMPAAAVADVAENVAETGPAEAPLVIRKGVFIYDADEGENGQD